MKSANCRSIVKIACLAAGLLSVPMALASDVDDLTERLTGFLGAADEKTAHQTFWADDLVYTSSNGTRFGKAEILAGFAEAEPSEEPPAISYSAEDIDIRVYGAVAIVAFKLVGTPSDDSDVLEYFNTGTFLKREGGWQVAAWQATRIPGATDAPD